MGQLKRVLETIQAQYAQLGVSQKLLFASLAVVMVMALFLVQQYTSEPAMVPLLPDAAAEDQATAVNFLRSRGHRYQIAPSGEVLVAPGAQFLVLAEMSNSGALPQDTSSVFDAMIEKQSWQQNSTQTHQIEQVTVQRALEQIIMRMPGVKSATVIVDIPQVRSFGQARQAPTASATVFADNGLDQRFADTLAHLVAGSRAGLTVDRVRIIDGTTRRQFRATAEDDLGATTYLEQMLAIEKNKQAQIYDMLGYIQGVIVSVHVQVDNTRRTRQDKTVKPEGAGSVSMLTGESATSSEHT
ncbi:MAG: hypothetical protein KDA21_04260, partial [Phycisphaerales bacterium]|nr:hypothetical protein [Phycisphaerales bacterium]